MKVSKSKKGYYYKIYSDGKKVRISYEEYKKIKKTKKGGNNQNISNNKSTESSDSKKFPTTMFVNLSWAVQNNIVAGTEINFVKNCKDAKYNNNKSNSSQKCTRRLAKIISEMKDKPSIITIAEATKNTKLLFLDNVFDNEDNYTLFDHDEGLAKVIIGVDKNTQKEYKFKKLFGMNLSLINDDRPLLCLYSTSKNIILLCGHFPNKSNVSIRCAKNRFTNLFNDISSVTKRKLKEFLKSNNNNSKNNNSKNNNSKNNNSKNNNSNNSKNNNSNNSNFVNNNMKNLYKNLEKNGKKEKIKEKIKNIEIVFTGDFNDHYGSLVRDYHKNNSDKSKPNITIFGKKLCMGDGENEIPITCCYPRRKAFSNKNNNPGKFDFRFTETFRKELNSLGNNNIVKNKITDRPPKGGYYMYADYIFSTFIQSKFNTLHEFTNNYKYAKNTYTIINNSLVSNTLQGTKIGSDHEPVIAIF